MEKPYKQNCRCSTGIQWGWGKDKIAHFRYAVCCLLGQGGKGIKPPGGSLVGRS